MRISDYFKDSLGAPSVRSRNLELLKERFVAELKNDFDEANIRETIDRFAKASVTAEESDAEEAIEADQDEVVEEAGTPSKKIACAPWVVDEIRALCEILAGIEL